MRCDLERPTLDGNTCEGMFLGVMHAPILWVRRFKKINFGTLTFTHTV